MIGDLCRVGKNYFLFFVSSTHIPWREHSITQSSAPPDTSTSRSYLCCNWNWTRIWAVAGQYLDIHLLSTAHSILLQNFDTNAVIDVSDSPARLWLNDIYGQADKGGLERTLRELCEGWFGFNTRTSQEESIWVNHLSNYLDDLVAQRLDHVQEWIRSNTSRFTGNHAGAENLRRAFEVESVELMRNVQLCKTTCNDCHLHCIRAKLHEGLHHCATDHKCSQSCQFAEEHSWTSEPCRLPYVCSFTCFIATAHSSSTLKCWTQRRTHVSIV